MIITQEPRDVQVSGNFQTRAFTIRAGAKAFEILSSKIYSHKVRAIVREISCNAYDSHVEAGNTAQFDVHLPTNLESWFSVRDYGPGISPEDIVEVYTTYFFSTKDNSNDYIGGLGIGAKSFFCLYDSFTVISYYDSIKYTYSCYKDKLGEPQIALLSECYTDEPNGLLVTVTVESWRVQEFRREAVNVFKYFDNIPNINVESVVEDIKLAHKYTLVGDDFAVSGDYGDFFAVMGNVAYRVPSEYNDESLSGYVKFGIGELNFDPGRENLSMDDMTKRVLKTRMDKLDNEISQLIIDKIEAEPTSFKRALVWDKINDSRLAEIIKKSKLVREFNNYKLPKCSTNIKYFSRGRKNQIKNNLHPNLPLENALYYVFKKGATNKVRELTRTTRADKIALLTQEQIDELNIDAEFILDPDTLPKTARSYNKVPTNQVFLYKDGRRTLVKEVPDGPKVYVEISRDEPVAQNNALVRINWCSSFNKIDEALLKFKKYITIPDVYIVKTAYTKTVRFSKVGWVPIHEYIQDAFTKVPKGSCITYTGNYADLFKKVAKISQFGAEHLLTQFIDKCTMMKKLEECPMLKEVGYYGEVESLDELESIIVKDYPIFSLVRTSDFVYGDNSEKLKIILNYILLTDNQV